MAYITRANFKRISLNLSAQNIINPDDVDSAILCEDIPTMEFNYFNKMEKQILLAFKEFVLHPEILFKPEYKKLSTQDTKTYVFESVAAYHNNLNCEKLNHDFTGILLPMSIRKQGDDKIAEFRQWYRENMHFLEEEKQDIFEMHLQNKFGIQHDEIAIIDKRNSGAQTFEDYSLEDVCEDIKKLATSFREWLLNEQDEEKKKLKKYSFIIIAYKGKCTYWGDDKKYLEEIRSHNGSDFSDEEIANCLREAHEKYKKPMIELLKRYYMIKYNANSEVDDSLLKALGFKPCSKCYPISFENPLQI